MQSDWSQPTVTVVIQNDPHINAFSMYSMYVKRSTLPCCEYWNDDHANVEANPSSPGWMDGMAVNVQSMVLLSTRLEKQDAKPSQRRRRIKNYWSRRDGGDWFFSGLMEVLSTLSSEAGNGTIAVSFECRRDNPCVPCIRSTAQTIKSISFILQILCTITHNLISYWLQIHRFYRWWKMASVSSVRFVKLPWTLNLAETWRKLVI